MKSVSDKITSVIAATCASVSPSGSGYTVTLKSAGLTKTEFELLGLLLKHRGQVFSRQQIFDAVWPEDVVVSDRTVDVNITRMRKKIGRYGKYVVSRQGYGYVFEP